MIASDSIAIVTLTEPEKADIKAAYPGDDLQSLRARIGASTNLRGLAKARRLVATADRFLRAVDHATDGLDVQDDPNGLGESYRELVTLGYEPWAQYVLRSNDLVLPS